MYLYVCNCVYQHYMYFQNIILNDNVYFWKILKTDYNHHHHLDQQWTKLDLLFLVRDGSTSEPIEILSQL